MPRLIAASVALVALGGTSTWLMMSRTPLMAPPAAEGPSAAPGGVTPVGLTAGQLASANAEIAQLERALALSRARLDPETVRVIEQNLAMIDAAIDEVRKALQIDPGNAYLNLHMADTMQRKLELLQEVDALARTQ